jgi:hypothetical protein
MIPGGSKVQSRVSWSWEPPWPPSSSCATDTLWSLLWGAFLPTTSLWKAQRNLWDDRKVNFRRNRVRNKSHFISVVQNFKETWETKILQDLPWWYTTANNHGRLCKNENVKWNEAPWVANYCPIVFTHLATDTGLELPCPLKKFIFAHQLPLPLKSEHRREECLDWVWKSNKVMISVGEREDWHIHFSCKSIPRWT